MTDAAKLGAGTLQVLVFDNGRCRVAYPSMAREEQSRILKNQIWLRKVWSAGRWPGNSWAYEDPSGREPTLDGDVSLREGASA